MEQKQHTVEAYEQTLNWVKELEELSEKQWRMPLAPGKWTIAEVIGHLIPWDIFVMEQRLPSFFAEVAFPVSPTVEEVNKLANEKSRVKTKKELIDSFIAARTKLIAAIKKVPNEHWQQELPQMKNRMTLSDYFKGLLDHDHRHFEEISEALRRYSDR